MDPVDAALARLWPTSLRTSRLVLRPVADADSAVVAELLTDAQVRRFLGGPATRERVSQRQRAYPATQGAWTVATADGDQAIGLVTITADHRCEGRAEVSYQLVPSAWGKGLAREAVGAAISFWHTAVPDGGPLVAITQQRNDRSRRLLESLGMALLDSFVEYGEQQCLYAPAGTEEHALRWLALVDDRRENAERRLGDLARAAPSGGSLPEDLSVLDAGQLARLCRARHGAHGRICARTAEHAPLLHLGRSRDGAWIAWRGDADHER